MADILLKAVTLPSGGRTDLGVRAGRLADPGTLTRPVVIDADGLVGLPGLVDLHTHLREPAPDPAETIASGTAAAARGGFTAVFAMANTDPVTDTAARVRHLRGLARSGLAEVVPVGAITRSLAGTVVADLEAMYREGVTYFSDDGRAVMDALIMRQALRRIAALGGVAAEHCQDHRLAGATAWRPDSPGPAGPPDDPADPEIWPRAAEAVIVARDVQLARDTGAHVHLMHLSTAESVDIVRWAKARGIPVTAEVTPHHLLLDAGRLTTDPVYKVNPPLRTAEDREELRQALADGTIDVVATDHAPHHPADKARPLPDAKPGMTGLEWALGIVLETMVIPGRLDYAGLADRMSHTPARIGQVAGRQGRPLTPGEPATLTLIDPTRRRVVDRSDSLSRARNNPYHGLDLPDPVMATFWAGRPTYADPSLTGLTDHSPS